MPKRSQPSIAARKSPKQARSSALVLDVLEAAIRVLKREGAARFTTVRVADEAGVSVGSLYQYFPSKEALLFRLQADEWVETWEVMEEILGDTREPPMERLRRAVLTFFRSEREEASLRVALDDAGALFRNVPQARAHVARARQRVLAFVEEALPEVPHETRVFAADFVMTSMGAVAEKVTEQARSRAEVDVWARASAEMYVAYLEGLRAGAARPVARPRG